MVLAVMLGGERKGVDDAFSSTSLESSQLGHKW